MGENLLNAKRIVVDMVDNYFKEVEEYLNKNYLFPAKKKNMGRLTGVISNFEKKLAKMEKIYLEFE